MATKSFKASYVELRHKTYFAILYVPKDVRHIIGKMKFYKSTQTGILGDAEAIASVWVTIGRCRYGDASQRIN